MRMLWSITVVCGLCRITDIIIFFFSCIVASLDIHECHLMPQRDGKKEVWNASSHEEEYRKNWTKCGVARCVSEKLYRSHAMRKPYETSIHTRYIRGIIASVHCVCCWCCHNGMAESAVCIAYRIGLRKAVSVVRGRRMTYVKYAQIHSITIFEWHIHLNSSFFDEVLWPVATICSSQNKFNDFVASPSVCVASTRFIIVDCGLLWRA